MEKCKNNVKCVKEMDDRDSREVEDDQGKKVSREKLIKGTGKRGKDWVEKTAETGKSA